MPRKRSKVVLIIVEGPTDETALEQFFSEKFDPNEVRIKVVHGDITADEDSTVTDTDGAYIPPENG